MTFIFFSAGIGSGSIAASLMSAAATTGYGGAAIATLQSAGAAGVGMASIATGAGVGAAIGGATKDCVKTKKMCQGEKCN